MAKPIENNKKKYMEYVQKKLKKYKVNDPSKVPGKHKKKFFTELDKGWESKEEKAKKKEKNTKKSDMLLAVKDKLSAKNNLESLAKDWNSTLKRIVRYLVINLSSNNVEHAKKQVDLLRQSCDVIDALLEDSNKKSVTKVAPNQPPKCWWNKMHKTVQNKNPDLSDGQVSKIVGGIWYSRMSPEKKKEVTKEFES